MSAKKEEKKERWTFFLIVPLLMKESIEKVIAVLVKRGYTVGPLAMDDTCYKTEDMSMTTILQLKLEKSLSSKEASGRDAARVYVISDVKDVLEVTKTLHYMIWVGDPGSMCTWQLGNIKRDAAGSAETGSYRTASKPGGDVN